MAPERGVHEKKLGTKKTLSDHIYQDLRLRAEHTWSESRKLHPKGQNETTDSVLAELRGLLDALKKEQHDTMPSNYEDDLSAALAETEIEDLADIADGEIETLVSCSISPYSREDY
jgi:hypothetical protein